MLNKGSNNDKREHKENAFVSKHICCTIKLTGDPVKLIKPTVSQKPVRFTGAHQTLTRSARTGEEEIFSKFILELDGYF